MQRSQSYLSDEGLKQAATALVCGRSFCSIQSNDNFIALALLQALLYPGCSTGWKPSGAKRIRTADPLHAMQVLYQLSYGPNPARRP